MFEFDIRCLLHGSNFSPTSTEKDTGLSLDKKVEVGDIGKIGRYRNKKIPYGSACIKPPVMEIDLETSLEEIVELLVENIQSFRENGAETISLHLDVNYDNQCNLEFSPSIIKKISILEVPFTISCYKN